MPSRSSRRMPWRSMQLRTAGSHSDLASIDRSTLYAVSTSAPLIRGLDLQGVGFMDSSGLRVIAVTLQDSQDRGRRFALVPGAAQVMRVFDITRMRERLEFVQDPREVMGEP